MISIMNKTGMKKILLFSALSMLNMTYGQTTGSDKILFMKFKMTNNEISLSACQLAEGKFTAGSSSVGEINYEIINSQNAIINTGFINNSLHVKYEYEDYDNNGELKSIFIKKDYAEFFIRTSYKSDISKINFYKYELDRNSAQMKKESDVYKKKLISSIQLPELNK
jgi:hypothetical protein